MTRARDVADTQDNVGGSVAPFVAGKNKIINGDFGIWQRGTSFTNPNAGDYSADRWSVQGANRPSASSITRETFTPGAAPVAGYEGQYFLRNTITTNTGGDWYLLQKVEDVRTLAGRTFTLSFWAKADSNRELAISGLQYFGPSGSASVAISGSTVNITSSWQRFSVILNVPSISGKTVNAGSFTNIVFQQAIANGSVLDIWGVQLESGNVATPFTTATGNPASELAACQRYYFRWTPNAIFQDASVGYNASATVHSGVTQFPVEMRVAPTALEQSGTASHYNVLHQAGGAPARTLCSAVPNFQSANRYNARTYFTVASGLTAGQGSMAGNDNNTIGYLGWSAEL